MPRGGAVLGARGVAGVRTRVDSAIRPGGYGLRSKPARPGNAAGAEKKQARQQRQQPDFTADPGGMGDPVEEWTRKQR